MPKVTINGRDCEFTPGQMIIQVANANGIDIPQYCYHDGLSIVASCRICLAEVWQPNPRNNNALEPIPKLVPTCQTACADGMVIYSDSPKAIANQKAVMEYLLINHPLDCPVCDQSGECFLQDYSYEYGRGVSRFEEAKVKNPKKDLGDHVYLYADRCIMCTRCVRFTREVTGTSELLVQGRGNKNEIDVFPGKALNNELSGNVIDLCPVGALLDKDFLFTQRVWFLKETPSIDGITASGDNIRIDHNDGKVYRVKPRQNMAANKWWISDEVRYGWKHVHSEDRILTPRRRQFGVQVESDWNRAYNDAAAGIKKALGAGGRLGVVISPMLSCEDAFALARLALSIDAKAVLAVGPVPTMGQDKVFPPDKPDGFKIFAEKAPNARGVKLVLDAVAKSGASVVKFDELVGQMRGGSVSAAIITGNYPSDWATDGLLNAIAGGNGKKPFAVVIDTLGSRLADAADIVLPSCTWMEKSGSFISAREAMQAFEQAIPAIGLSKSEGQIALDFAAVLAGHASPVGTTTIAIDPEMAGQVPGAVEVAAPMAAAFDAVGVRREMSGVPGLEAFAEVAVPSVAVEHTPDMQVVEI
jgi:NADH-quinone oxidoreductase subunit G